MLSPQQESVNQLNNEDYDVTQLEQVVQQITISDNGSIASSVNLLLLSDAEIIEHDLVPDVIASSSEINGQVSDLTDDIENHKSEHEIYTEPLLDIPILDKDNEKNTLSFQEQGTNVVENIPSSPEDSETADFKSLTHEGLHEMESYVSSESHTRPQIETQTDKQQMSQSTRPYNIKYGGVNIHIENMIGNVYIKCFNFKKRDIPNPDCEAYCEKEEGGCTLLNEICNDKNIQNKYANVCELFGFEIPCEIGDKYDFLYENLGDYLRKTQMTRYDLFMKIATISDVSHLLKK